VKNGPDKKIQNEELSKTIDNLFRSKISYPTIKEKLVGRTIEYRPDIESIFDSITTIYASDTELKSFLDSNKQTIIRTFQKSDTQNIRALKGSLDTFKVVHTALRATGKSILHKHELGLLVFVLAVSFEIKTNELRIKEFRHMNSSYEYHFVSLTRKNEGPEPYIKGFCDKYFSEGQFENGFSKIVIRYIADGFFDEGAFLREFRQEEEEIADDKLKKVKLVRSYPDLDNNDFKQATKDVLRYVGSRGNRILNFLNISSIFRRLDLSKRMLRN
jgi:hypothetical protein